MTTCRLKYSEDRVELHHLPWSIWDLVVQIWPEFFKDSMYMSDKLGYEGKNKVGALKAINRYGRCYGNASTQNRTQK